MNIVNALDCRRGGADDGEAQAGHLIALTGEGHDASEDGTGRGTPLVPVAYRVHGEHSTAMTGNGDAAVAAEVDVARSLDSCGGYATNQGGNVVAMPEVAQPLRGNPHNNSDPGMEAKMHVPTRMGIRRLTPRECERLQGFPDDWTRFDTVGKELSDSARYRMCGNAVCVSVSRWIGRRIVETANA